MATSARLKNRSPNSVTSIGEGAFYFCNALTSIKIPDSITSIGNGAFAGCNAIVSIMIPNSVTSIGHSVFSYCSKLSVLEVEENNPNYYSKDNVLFSMTQQLLCCPVAKQGVYVVPNNVREICDHAFDACDELTSLYIPNSVVNVLQKLSNQEVKAIVLGGKTIEITL